MASESVICYTLDLEHDYAGVAPTETYETLSKRAWLERFSDLVHRHDCKLTVFATGKVLEQQREAVAFFRRMGAEIELHSYDHILDERAADSEVHKGVVAYQDFFGKVPLGYRAPGGVLSPTLMEELVRAGIKYDSSVIPSFRFGMYNNLGSPLEPYLHPHLPLIELPIAVVPRVRLLIATSYIRILGFPLYRILLGLFGRPSPVVYLLHLVDLIPVEMRKRLSPVLRCAHARGEGKGLEVFETSVQYFESAGYRSDYMSNVYKEYAVKLSAQGAKSGG
jgi:peptidoglycan/xylan/chitin deacetylase (PgdA/CDA1 family)